MPIPRHVRSTLLITSRGVLRQASLFETYEATLREPTRQRLRECIAGSWLPLELAREHYMACESLALTPTEQIALGKQTGDRMNGTLLGTIMRLAKSAGVTPWTLIEQLERFWRRGFDGGDVIYQRGGPKDARVVLKGLPLLDIPYFRNGLAGTCEAQLSAFCTRAFVRIERYEAGSQLAAYRYQWA